MDHRELSKLTMADLFRRWPPTGLVVNRSRMACVGCAMAPFCTVEEAMQSYQMDREQFLQSLLDAIQESASETA